MLAAKIIYSVDILKIIFAFIGRESFHIMALHFVGFKVLNSLCVFCYDSDLSLMSYYCLPYIPSEIYVIFGVGVPLLLRKIYQLATGRVNF